MTMPAITACLFPVAATAFLKSGLSHGLISPGRSTTVALGSSSRISGTKGPLGPEKRVSGLETQV